MNNDTPQSLSSCSEIKAYLAVVVGQHHDHTTTSTSHSFDDTQQVIALRAGRSVIGRRMQGNVTHVIEFECISREHVAIEMEENELTFVEDLGSRNMTRLIVNNNNNSKYTSSSKQQVIQQLLLKSNRFYQLQHGNMIMLGNVLLRFLLVSELTASEMTALTKSDGGEMNESSSCAMNASAVEDCERNNSRSGAKSAQVTSSSTEESLDALCETPLMPNSGNVEFHQLISKESHEALIESSNTKKQTNTERQEQTPTDLVISSLGTVSETPLRNNSESSSNNSENESRKILVFATPVASLDSVDSNRSAFEAVPDTLEQRTPGSFSARSTPSGDIHKVLVFETPMRTVSKFSPVTRQSIGFDFVPPTLDLEYEEQSTGSSPFASPMSVVPETPDRKNRKKEQHIETIPSEPLALDLIPPESPFICKEGAKIEVSLSTSNENPSSAIDEDDTDCDEPQPAPAIKITYSPRTTPEKVSPKQEPAFESSSITTSPSPKLEVPIVDQAESVKTEESELLFEDTQSEPARMPRKRRGKTRRKIIDEDETSESERKDSPKRKRSSLQDSTTNEYQGIPSETLFDEEAIEEKVPKIFFTGIIATAQHKRAIKNLGGVFVENEVFEELSQSRLTHLVTDKIRRTVKFLCALGKVDHIVSINWITDSQKAKKFLPEDEYMLQDEETENKLGVCLSESFERRKQMYAAEVHVFSGKHIFVTPSVKPPPSEMQHIVECNGGTFINNLSSLKSKTKTDPDSIIIVTCADDAQYCCQKILPVFTKYHGGSESDHHSHFFTNEIVLSSVMRQEPAGSEHQFSFPEQDPEEEENNSSSEPEAVAETRPVKRRRRR